MAGTAGGDPAAPSGDPATPSGDPAARSGDPATPSGEPAAPSGGGDLGDDTAVAPDGSPVAVYRRLPGDREAAVVAGAVPPGSTVLELGCGAGRVTHLLVALGYRVTAVDESPAMLAAVRGAATVLDDVACLDLGRRFDAVLLGSHFVNVADATLRRSFLATCARHVGPGGVVLVERHEPGWVATAVPERREVHGVVLDLHDVARDGDRLRAVVTYELDGRRFDQPFEVVEMDDARLASEAAAVGLRVDRCLDDRRCWVALVPTV